MPVTAVLRKAPVVLSGQGQGRMNRKCVTGSSWNAVRRVKDGVRSRFKIPISVSRLMSGCVTPVIEGEGRKCVA